MPEFARVLTVAVLSLIMLFIIFGGNIYFQKPQEYYVSGEELRPQYSKTIDLGSFNVYFKENKIVPVNFYGEIRKGLIEDVSKCFEFSLSNLESISSGRIEFFVKNTNSYGNLIFVLNNKIIYNKLKYIGPGSFDINVNDLKKDNLFCIKTESPGFRFWVSTVYWLDLQLILIEQNSSYSKIFELSENELSNIKNAVLTAEAIPRSEEIKDFIIKFNNETIYSGKDSNLSIQIPLNLLKTTNKIEFIATETPWSILDAKIELSG
ncbi:MAG: hypothetical protein QXF15_03155 [Candidatus Aenigmatarchaeota archaeon]